MYFAEYTNISRDEKLIISTKIRYDCFRYVLPIRFISIFVQYRHETGLSKNINYKNARLKKQENHSQGNLSTPE